MRRFLVAALVVAGCDLAPTEPTPAWVVAEPRVLAISAMPPSVFPTGSTELRALVTDGFQPQVAAEGSWRACAPWIVIRNPDLDCGPEQSVPLPSNGSGGATLSVPEVAAAFGVPVPDIEPAQSPCDVESPVSIPVVYEARVDDRRLVAIKEVPIANAGGRNPSIQVRISGTEELGGVRYYQPGQEHTLDVSVAHESLDLVCDDDEGDGDVDLDLERVRVYVYVTGGELDDSRLDVEHDASGNETAESSTWTAPDGGEVTVWLVATERGGRPGIGWVTEALAPR